MQYMMREAQDVMRGAVARGLRHIQQNNNGYHNRIHSGQGRAVFSYRDLLDPHPDNQRVEHANPREAEEDSDSDIDDLPDLEEMQWVD